jgi:hypothetical protein
MTLNSPQIWRINLKPGAKKGKNPVTFCLDKGILGFGWSIQMEGEVDWETYRPLATLRFGGKGWKTAINNLRRMRINDLCWTRNRGIYYLGRITGEWRYIGGGEHEENNVVNFRNCDWLEVGNVDDVPGLVQANFRAPNTLSSVRDQACIYSSFIFNQKKGTNYVIDSKHLNLFDLLDDSDCEDLVGIHMQLLGYVLIPSSCKKDTPDVEWVAYHSETGQKAVAQVKTGNSTLNPFSYERYTNGGTKVFLFSPQQATPNEIPELVHWVNPDDIQTLLSKPSFQRLMPYRIRYWLKIHHELNQMTLIMKK